MKYLILILLALPSHLFGQVDKYSDTLETEQTEIKGKLLYEIGSDVPFTGVNLSTFSHGFAGYFTYYTDGIKDTSRVTQWDLLTNKEGQVTGKLVAYKTLKGNTWETTGQTKYNSVGLKLSHYDYENNVETFYYECCLSGGRKCCPTFLWTFITTDLEREHSVHGVHPLLCDFFGPEILSTHT